MCKKEMSATERKIRGENLVKISYALGASVLTLLIGKGGCNLITAGSMSDYLFWFLIVCIFVIYYAMQKGVEYQEPQETVKRKCEDGTNLTVQFAEKSVKISGVSSLSKAVTIEDGENKVTVSNLPNSISICFGKTEKAQNQGAQDDELIVF